jgi:2-polyprenyl-3-methyl-5-hydroxy-6-metoxy-1,4-benzoquinol methylase
MFNNFCPVCNSLMNSGLKNWHWECAKCGYEKADFEPAINEALAHDLINEPSREKGLRSLRIQNFSRLLQAIVREGYGAGRLLDVGCAHGWFLEAAQKRGFQALGIEPDLTVFKTTAKRGLSIRQGFFPDILASNEQFDVIVFNDVFEHIPNLSAVLAGCRNHLKPEGVLVLNLPSSSGIFYKVARVLSRVNINNFFERLWQKGLPSPHLHYFNSNNLQLLLQSNGFEEVVTGRLSTVQLKGLFTRISYTKDSAFPVRLLICLLVGVAFPLIMLMPSDIIYSISKKNYI